MYKKIKLTSYSYIIFHEYLIITKERISNTTDKKFTRYVWFNSYRPTNNKEKKNIFLHFRILTSIEIRHFICISHLMYFFFWNFYQRNMKPIVFF